MRNGRFSQVISTAILGSVLGLAALQSQGTPPKPCATPEYRQFDFWIGEWTVTNPDGKVVGTNVIERVAGGCGLQETWTAGNGGSGRSLNAYSPQDGKWHQIWLGSGGLWMPLSGGLRDGSMVLEGQTLDREKKVIHQRITWTPQQDGRVRQLWEQSRDGKKWTVGFDGMYAKQAAGAGAAAEDAVRKTIEDHYFRAQATGVGAHLEGVFIPEARMMWTQAGQLRVRSSTDYVAGFPGKPADDEAKRSRRVLMVDVTGDAAVAKVELDFPSARLVDYFTLLKIDGTWKIVHKSFVRL